MCCIFEVIFHNLLIVYYTINVFMCLQHQQESPQSFLYFLLNSGHNLQINHSCTILGKQASCNITEYCNDSFNSPKLICFLSLFSIFFVFNHDFLVNLHLHAVFEYVSYQILHLKNPVWHDTLKLVNNYQIYVTYHKLLIHNRLFMSVKVIKKDFSHVKNGISMS